MTTIAADELEPDAIAVLATTAKSSIGIRPEIECFPLSSGIRISHRDQLVPESAQETHVDSEGHGPTACDRAPADNPVHRADEKHHRHERDPH